MKPCITLFARILAACLCICSVSAQADEVVVLDPVIVHGSVIDFAGSDYSPPDGFWPRNSRVWETRDTSIFRYIGVKITEALKLSDVCNAPVSAMAKEITGDSDMLSRWFAAQEVFNIMQQRNLINLYHMGAKIQIVMAGVKYYGFSVKYSDGFTEVWVVTPNAGVSSVKLFDTPMPDSLMAPDSPRSGCTGLG